MVATNVGSLFVDLPRSVASLGIATAIVSPPTAAGEEVTGIFAVELL